MNQLQLLFNSSVKSISNTKQFYFKKFILKNSKREINSVNRVDKKTIFETLKYHSADKLVDFLSIYYTNKNFKGEYIRIKVCLESSRASRAEQSEHS